MKAHEMSIQRHARVIIKWINQLTTGNTEVACCAAIQPKKKRKPAPLQLAEVKGKSINKKKIKKNENKRRKMRETALQFLIND